MSYMLLKDWEPIVKEAEEAKKNGIDYEEFCRGKGFKSSALYGAKKRLLISKGIVRRTPAKKRGFVEFAPVTDVISVQFHGAVISCTPAGLPKVLHAVKLSEKEE